MNFSSLKGIEFEIPFCSSQNEDHPCRNLKVNKKWLTNKETTKASKKKKKKKNLTVEKKKYIYI